MAARAQGAPEPVAAAGTRDWDAVFANLTRWLAGGPQNYWHGFGSSAFETVAQLPPEVRAGFAGKLSLLYHAQQDATTAARLLTLLTAVAPAYDDRVVRARRERLAHLARGSVAWDDEELRVLAEAELATAGALPPAVVALVRRNALAGSGYLDRTLPALAARLADPPVSPGEQWSDAALEQLPSLAPGFASLLAHAATATTPRPTAAWDGRARELLAELGERAVLDAVPGWLALVGRPRTMPWPDDEWRYTPNIVFDPYNAFALRGLAWTLSLLTPGPEVSRTLGALLETSLRKAPGVGPRSPKVANACVLALARLDDASSLAEIARLSSRVTYKGTLNVLNAALESRASVLGLSRAEIEELAVPDYGLTEVGGGTQEFGECVAELRVEGCAVALAWRTAAGKAVKAAPVTVRRDHAEELKELKGRAKDIGKMLGAQSERLDRQFLARRAWDHASWRARYLDHPLVGTLARRLLWTVGGTACGWADGALRTVDGGELAAPGDDARVELWHPVGRDDAEVLAWRAWLERHGVTQPFKQAHREVYPLTDAERATGTYSNRFAGHVLRQHQVHSLAAVRGWTDTLRLRVDDSVPPPYRELPEWGLRAEYWVAGDASAGNAELTSNGSFLYLRTDQVRFYPIGAPLNYAQCGTGAYETWDMRTRHRAHADPLPLESVPALVLSEVLRDVDLFVGVASVGSDPAWSDGGPGGRYRDYWHSFGFGELTKSAEVRRDLLASLLPRLAVGGRCAIEGRYVHVTGTRHTYRIHLGSGNVLIAPHDRYLCVVPKAAPAEPGYVPFEGDRTLSVILSKVLLLAKDDEITDRTILSQL